MTYVDRFDQALPNTVCEKRSRPLCVKKNSKEIHGGAQLSRKNLAVDVIFFSIFTKNPSTVERQFWYIQIFTISNEPIQFLYVSQFCIRLILACYIFQFEIKIAFKILSKKAIINVYMK